MGVTSSTDTGSPLARNTAARTTTTVARYVRPVTRVLLVRHGQSEWNATGRWQGHADPGLTALGEEQAAAAAATLAREEPPIARIATSDLVRARRTAEIMSAALGVECVVDPRWRERNAGDWQGLTRAEIEEGWPGHLADGRRPDRWEHDDAVVGRALDALTAADVGARAAGHGVVVVVTHGGVVRTLERHLGDPTNELLPNLGGRWFDVDGDAVGLGPRVLVLDGVAVTRPGQI
jgi:broad specificity phosphatase PhoE